MSEGEEGDRDGVRCVVYMHIHVYCAEQFFCYIPSTYNYIYMFLMRDEKEERKKQARSNKQGKATQHTQGSHFS